MSIDRDLKTLKRIADRLIDRKLTLGKDIDEALSELEGKLKIPFKCAYCGYTLNDENEEHICKGKRYIIRADRELKIQKKPNSYRFYQVRILNKIYWFESIEFANKFLELIKNKACIQEAINNCGSELIKYRFPKFKTKINEVNEDDK